MEKVVQDTGPVCNHCLKEKAVARVLELVTEEEAKTLSSIPGEHTFKVETGWNERGNFCKKHLKDCQTVLKREGSIFKVECL